MKRKREPLCWKCGVEMESRENFIGCGYCYICAEQFSPARLPVDKSMQAIEESS